MPTQSSTFPNGLATSHAAFGGVDPSGHGFGSRIALGAQPHRSHCQRKHSKVRGLPRQPNMRLKLTARGSRLIGKRSILIAAATGRSLSAPR